MPKVHKEQLTHNPYRDMEKNPVPPHVIASLTASIEKTGFWDNVLGRPAGNEYNGMAGDELQEYLETLSEVPSDMIVELAYGHRRWVTLNAMDGIEIINIPIKVIDDENMLHIMCEENKDDYGADTNVLLETCRQVRVTLHEQAKAFESFEDYAEVHSFFRTAKDWSMAAKDIENIGFRRVHQFLGETWSENHIRTGFSVLKAIDAGYFTQEQIVGFPSVQLLNRFVGLAKAIRDNATFPPFFKDLYVDECAAIASDPDQGATVKIMTKASTMTKKGNVPTDYLTKQKVTPFDLAKQLKLLVKTAPEDNPINPDDFLEVDGLKDHEGIDEAVAAVKEALKKDAERRERAGGADAEGEDEGTEGEDAQAAIAEAEKEAEEKVDAALPDVDMTEDGADSISALANTVVQSSMVYSAQMERLLGRVDEMDEKTEGVFGGAYEKAFVSMVKVGIQAFGKEDLLAMIEQAESTI